MEKKRILTTRKMTTIGVLSALTMVLGLTPLGFITLPFTTIQITTMHIPVIIGAILEGPVVGFFVGLIFGIFSFIRSFSTPSPLAFTFMNPLVSVLPRILIGLAAYYGYRFFQKIKIPENVALLLTGGLGTLVNTVGVLGMIYLIYAKVISETLNLPAGPLLLGVALTNGPAEIVAAAIIVLGVVKAMHKIKK